MGRCLDKLFDRRLATKVDYERWQEHDRTFKPGMIVKVVRRRVPVQLIEKRVLAGRLGVWFEARPILGGPTFLCATDHVKHVLCEVEAIAWAAR